MMSEAATELQVASVLDGAMPLSLVVNRVEKYLA